MLEIIPEYEAARVACACDHPETQVARRVAANGAMSFVKQCQRCGQATQVLKRANVPLRVQATAPEFDRELVEDWSRHRSEVWDEAREQLDARVKSDKEAKDAAWWRAYNRYLASPEWARKRRAVLARDGHQCKWCGQRPAVQVHHLTYDHVGREGLPELVAICQPCHDEVHTDRDGLARWADDGGR